MDLRVIFLGTAASLPTTSRSLPSLAVMRKGELLLFDCGEGTQRQMAFAGIGFCKRTKVFITHMHGDHVLGLPGLFQTMVLLNRSHPLRIFGPEGTCSFVESIMRTVKFVPTYRIEVQEVGEGSVCEEEDYQIRAVWADHGVPNLAYALIEKERPGKFYPERAACLGVPEGPLWSTLQWNREVRLPDGRVVTPAQVMGPPRPGRKIVYSGDTRPSQSVTSLARGADLLIHDSTLEDALREKAYEAGHSTPSEAAQMAKEARVKSLILTHISARYVDDRVLKEQAERIFPKVKVAEDFMELEIPYRE